jgi:hypothetical protein
VLEDHAHVTPWSSASPPLTSDLLIDGVSYKPRQRGSRPAPIEGQLDLSVPNLEVAGLLNSDAISEDDLNAGVWDGAAVEIFQVNYGDLTQGAMVLRKGTLGEIRAGRLNFSAEIRGMAQGLQQPVGERLCGCLRCHLGRLPLHLRRRLRDGLRHRGPDQRPAVLLRPPAASRPPTTTAAVSGHGG